MILRAWRFRIPTSGAISRRLPRSRTNMPQWAPQLHPHAGPASLVIAIDGPAASGKSSTAQWVARRLDVRHVDSGAFYRGDNVPRRSTQRPCGKLDFAICGIELCTDCLAAH